jgi:hypothetical protein
MLNKITFFISIIAQISKVFNKNLNNLNPSYDFVFQNQLQLIENWQNNCVRVVASHIHQAEVIERHEQYVNGKLMPDFEK